MNWVKTQHQINISIPDMLKALIKIGYKLVLCQLHELERLQLSGSTSHRSEKGVYVEQLYKHYIVNKLPKTYLCK